MEKLEKTQLKGINSAATIDLPNKNLKFEKKKKEEITYLYTP